MVPGGTSWVDVRDVVDGHLLALDRGKKGERYILAAENISNREIALRLALRQRRKPPLLELPSSSVRFMTRLATWIEKLPFQTPFESQSLSRGSGYFLYMNHEKSCRELGWNPRSPWTAIEAMGTAASTGLSLT
jgi:dihydroflavonol-4-reductase